MSEAGFHRIRHFGLFANTRRAAHLAKLRTLLEPQPAPAAIEAANDNAAIEDAFPCPCCGGRMRLIEVFERGAQPARPRKPRDKANLARLARMNMYLHGDGGSSIYEADFLDKRVADPDQALPEVRAEVKQLRDHLAASQNGFADIVVTNPPFAKVYDRKTERERIILDEYEIANGEDKLKSSLMFFERYYDVLKPGGRLVSVIDDGILSGSSFEGFRDHLRGRFLVRAVVSLPGDAFQRSQARVKTSFVVLEKRLPGAQQE